MRTPLPHRRAAFTLIELLTVIAIIGILAAILIPTVSGVRKRAMVVEATSDSRAIANGWKLYYAGRGKWFDPQDFEGEGTDAKSSERDDGEVFWNAYVKLLSGRFESGETTNSGTSFNSLNPGAEPYLDITEDKIDENGEFIDPWEQPYKFKLDKKTAQDSDGETIDVHIIGDHRIGRFSYADLGDPSDPDEGQIIIEDIAIAWSRGADGFDTTPEDTEDDPTSW